MNDKKQSLIEHKVENDADKLAKSQDWESATKFPWSEKIHEILRNVFGLKKFRSSQLSVINATLSGNDVMVIMPTGGGKSLCYQLPALANTPNKGKGDLCSKFLKLNYCKKVIFFPHPFICQRRFSNEKVGNQKN